jgi:hypothetical protein
MSTPAIKHSPGDPPGPVDLNKPKQASRSVSLLTPEQLQRKRAQDRESQRQTRCVKTRVFHRELKFVKQTIAELEKRVETLTQELHLTRLENASLQEKNRPPPPGTIPTMAPPQVLPGPEDFPDGSAANMDVAVRRSSQQQQCMGMGSQFPNSLVVTGQISSSISIDTSTDQELTGTYRSRTPDNNGSKSFLLVRRFRTAANLDSGVECSARSQSCNLQV